MTTPKDAADDFDAFDCSSASECVRDTNNDGDCQHCVRRGGCIAIGGPFIKCVDCGEVKPNAEMMIRQPYCRGCY